MEGNDRGDLRSGGVRRTQPQDEVQEGRESGEVGPDHGRGMEPQGPEQAKMDEDAGDGGDIDNQELGDNLLEREVLMTHGDVTRDFGVLTLRTSAILVLFVNLAVRPDGLSCHEDEDYPCC